MNERQTEEPAGGGGSQGDGANNVQTDHENDNFLERTFNFKEQVAMIREL